MPLYSVQGPDNRMYALEGPEGTTEEQLQAALRQHFATAKPASKAVSAGDVGADLGYSALSGIGSLVQFPGQAFGLATGDMGNAFTSATTQMGGAISKYAQAHKSAGLQAREAAQNAAIAEASKKGFLSEAGTAFTSTLKDPVLLGNFLAENIPNIIPGFVVSRGTMALGMRAVAKQVAEQGLEGAAKDAAMDAAQKTLAKKAEALAVSAAVTQQGADVGAQAYKDIYDKQIAQGVSAPEAAAKALSLARAAGATGAVISYLSSRLPGARALEQSFAGAQGAKAAATGALKGGVGESISEGVEEGGGTLARNAAMATVDPTQNIMQGVGRATGQGAILGGVMGGGAGMVSSGHAADIANSDALRQQAAAQEAQAQQQAQQTAAAEAKRSDPAYLNSLLGTYDQYRTKIDDLKAAGSAGDKADPLAQAQRGQAKRELDALIKSPEFEQHKAEVAAFQPELDALRIKNAADTGAQAAQAKADTEAKDAAAQAAKAAQLADPVRQAQLHAEFQGIGGQLADTRNKIDVAVRSGDTSAVPALHAQFDALNARKQELQPLLGERPAAPPAPPTVEAMQERLQRLVGTTTRNGSPKAGEIMKALDSGDMAAHQALLKEAETLRAQIAEPTRARDAALRQAEAFKARQAAAETAVEPTAETPAASTAPQYTKEGAEEYLKDVKDARRGILRRKLNTGFTEQRDLLSEEGGSAGVKAAAEQKQAARKVLVGQLQEAIRKRKDEPTTYRPVVENLVQQIRDLDKRGTEERPARGVQTAEMAGALAGTWTPAKGMPASQAVEDVARVYTPTTASVEAVREQLGQLPVDLDPQNEALVGQITDALPALQNAGMPAETVKVPSIEGAPYERVTAKLAPTKALDDVAAYLYKLRTGADASAEAAQVQEHLARLEQGKRSETQTPARETAWGTATKPTETATQADMFPDTELHGTIFNTYAEFEDYLAGDAVKEARQAVGATLATAARLQRQIAPMEVELARLQADLAKAQAAQRAVIESGEANVTVAQAKHRGAVNNLRNTIAKIDATLDPLRAELSVAQLALSKAVAAEAAISDAVAKNTAKFNRDADVQAAAAKLAAAQAAHSASLNRAARTGSADFKETTKLYHAAVAAINEHRTLLEAYQKEARALPERSILAYLNRDMALMLRLRDAAQTVETAQQTVTGAQEALDQAHTALQAAPETQATMTAAKAAVSSAQDVLTRVQNKAGAQRSAVGAEVFDISAQLQELEWQINALLPTERAAAAKGRDPNITVARARINALKARIAQHNEQISKLKNAPTTAQIERARELAAELVQAEANLRSLQQAPSRGAEEAARTLAARTEETQAQREERDAEQRKAEQARTERMAAIPGAKVTHDSVRQTMAAVEKLPARIAELDAAAADETASKTARNKAKHDAKQLREHAKLLTGLIANDPDFAAAAVIELDKRIADTEAKVSAKQIAVNEPGQKASTLRSRRKELTDLRTGLRELKRLRVLSENRAAFSPLGNAKQTTRQLEDRFDAVQTRMTADAQTMSEERNAGLQAEADSIQRELDRRDEAEARLTLGRGIDLETMDTTGKLPPRIIGPVVRRITGSQKAIQGGARKGLTGPQAIAAAKRDTAHEQALLAQTKLEDLQERNDTALEKARETKNEELIAKHEAYADRLARGLEVAQKNVDKTASIVPEVSLLGDEWVPPAPKALAVQPVRVRASAPPKPAAPTPKPAAPTPKPAAPTPKPAAPTPKPKPASQLNRQKTNTDIQEEVVAYINNVDRTYSVTIDRQHPMTGAPMADVARWGASRSRNPLRKALFNRIAEVLDKADTQGAQGRVYFSSSKALSIPDGRSAAGMYLPAKDTVIVPTESANAQNLDILLHELTHAATTRGIRANGMLSAYVDNLRAQALNWINTPTGKAYVRTAGFGLQHNTLSFKVTGYAEAETDDVTRIYGLSSNAEFLAELFSNAPLQQMLAQIPSNVPRKSIWERLVHIVATYFNFKGVEGDTLLHEAMAVAEEVLDFTAGQRSEKRPWATDVGPSDELLFPAATVSYGDLEGTPVASLHPRVADNRSIKERFTNDLAMRAEYNMADMHIYAVEAMRRAGGHMGTQAEMDIRAAGAPSMIATSFIQQGAPEFFKDAKGYTAIRATTKDSGAAFFKAVRALPGTDAQAKFDMQTNYMKALRGLRLGPEKVGEDVTRAQLQAIVDQVRNDPKLYGPMEDARAKYNAFNDKLVAMAVESGAISEEFGKSMTEHGDYVAMYREKDGQLQMAMDDRYETIGDIAHTPFMHALKGGKERVLPINETIFMNTELLTKMALINNAKNNIGHVLAEVGKPHGKMEILPGTGPAGVETLTWKENGEAVHLKMDTEGTVLSGIPTAMLAQSIDGYHATLPQSLMWMQKANDMLRAGITRMPMYMLRQLLKDPASAAIVGGMRGGPVMAVARAFKEYGKVMTGQTADMDKIARMGLVQNSLLTGDPDDMQVIARQMAGGDAPSAIRAFLNFLDKSSSAANATTQLQIYNDSIKRGLSEVEAMHRTRESMNFHKRGASATVQQANRTLVFFNSGVQALNVLQNTLRGRMPFEERLQTKQKFVRNATLMVVGGFMYAASMSGDDEYRKLRMRDKVGNMHFALGDGEYVKLPISYFETGGGAWAAGQALAAMLEGDAAGSSVLKAMGQYALTAVPGGGGLPIGPGVKQIGEWATNKDFTTFRDIVPTSKAGLSPSEQFTAATPSALRDVGAALGVSPIKLDHMLQSLFGSAVNASLQLLEQVAPDETNARPTRGLSETPFVGTLFQNKTTSQATDDMYIAANDVTEVTKTLAHMQTEGRPSAEIRAYIADHRDELRLDPIIKQFTQQMAALSKNIAIIEESGRSPEEKKAGIDRLKKQKLDIAENLNKARQRILKESPEA